jgi:hypothetical protein
MTNELPLDHIESS